MALGPGSRVGVYEVTAQIGAGAMGVVFRARDTKLLREVALKVLPEHFADDPDRLSRLQREAQLLASLNHPNIAHVYGLEQAGGAACIAMEFVDGETLAERIARGPIPLDEAVGIAKQIAEGLAAAHQQGIVHRDLKPANIKLTPNGAVKVLDFGLAKPVGTGSPGSSSSMLPTMMNGSGVGTITGTVAYMSPEQARGKEVDARTDIWAFGCALYEMLVGRPAFDGETPTDIIAKVVTGHPDLDALPAGTPASVRLLLAATLNKNMGQRLQHIGDAALFLNQADVSVSAAASAAPPQSARNRRVAVGVAALAVVCASAIGAAGTMYVRSSSPPSSGSPMVLQIGLPSVAVGAGVSPDGKCVVYIAEPRGEKRSLWMRTLSSEAAQKIPGSDNPLGGAFSEDGRWLAFVAERKLKKFDTASGSEQTIADFSGTLRGASWSHGVILLATDVGLVRVSDEGGAVTTVAALDKQRKEILYVMPIFMPDGNHFVYAIISDQSVPENSGIFVGSLDGKTKTRLTSFGTRLSGMAYTPGYLLVAGESLTAQRFDASTLKLSGPTVPITTGPVESFGVSNTGLLLYRKSPENAADRQLAWFDRAGRQLDALGPKGNYGSMELSPTGDRVAVDMMVDGNSDVWVIDVARGVPSRITFAPSREWNPIWSPDGSKLAFGSVRNGSHTYQKSAAGVGEETPMFKSDKSEIPVAWSHDGRYIVFSRLKGLNGGAVDTWLMDLSGEPKVSPYIESPFDKAQARVSPDGHWLAYATNDSGMYQIMVQSFPDPSRGRSQITAQGGIEPKWRHDGRELYYLAFDGKLMAVPVKETKPGQPFEAGAAVALFQTPLTVSRTTPRSRVYDVAPDGRFLIAMPVAAGGPEPITAVVNWTAALGSR